MKKIFSSILAVLSLTALILVSCTGGDGIKPGTTAYIVDTYVGEVSVSHDSGNTWKAIEIGMILKENDMIKTGRDSFADIIMPERGIFRISFDSVIHLKNLSAKLAQVSVEKGKVFVNITEKLKSDEEFEVETQVAVVAARGTQFSVETDGESTTTAVNEGKVVALENIDVEGDAETQEAVEEALEVEITPDTQVEFDKDTKEKIEDEINESAKKDNPDKAAEKAKEIRKNNKPKTKNVMKKDKDVWDSLSKEEKKAMIKKKLQELHEEKKRQKEEKLDKEMLEKAMEKGRGKDSKAEKHVGPKTTTIQEDIKDDVANQKVKDTKEKLGIDNKVDDYVSEDGTGDDKDASSLIDKYKKDGKKSSVIPDKYKK